MHRNWIVLMLTAVLLSACAQNQTPNAAGETSQPLEAPSATPLDISAAPATGTEMECQVVSMSPTPGPTEVSRFPPVTEADWVLGNVNGTPALTIIEYSDFQ